MTTESAKKERLKAPIAARLWAVPVGRGNPSGVFLCPKGGAIRGIVKEEDLIAVIRMRPNREREVTIMKAVLQIAVNTTRGSYKPAGRVLYMPCGLLRSVLGAPRIDVKGQRHR